MRPISKVIIHCSDSPDHLDHIGFEQINQWHHERGFSDVHNGLHTGIFCGYHYVVKKDGVIEIGRPHDRVGAHCLGQNKESIGICWIGRRDMYKWQKDSLLYITSKVVLEYGLSVFDVYGHFELALGSGKTCPNFHFENTWPTMNEFKEDLTRYL